MGDPLGGPVGNADPCTHRADELLLSIIIWEAWTGCQCAGRIAFRGLNLSMSSRCRMFQAQRRKSRVLHRWAAGSWIIPSVSTASVRMATGHAFHAGAVADHGEITAASAGIALIAQHPGPPDGRGVASNGQHRLCERHFLRQHHRLSTRFRFAIATRHRDCHARSRGWLPSDRLAHLAVRQRRLVLHRHQDCPAGHHPA